MSKTSSVTDAFHLYDTTLRDGAQREGISYSVEDKLTVAKLLDAFGVGFIEGGWPGALPKDTEFFARIAAGELVLKNRQNTIDMVYPILGNYAILDFTKNSPAHSVHKIMGNFNRFSYLNFVEIKNV
jgi:hypothetical protein